MIQVRMGDEVARQCHKVPGLRSEIESYFEFSDTPVRLHSGAGIPINRQSIVVQSQRRGIVHRTDCIDERVVRALSLIAPTIVVRCGLDRVACGFRI